jgi:putative SbcD/Mre11-related phosphoesterase
MVRFYEDNMNRIKFITDYPAVFIEDEKILAIADLQIGFEHEMYKKGVTIQPQTEKFVKTINHLLKITKAKTLVIVGDLKHKVPGITLREERQLPKFFLEFEKKVEIVFVKGNHDTDLTGLIPDYVKVYDSKGVKIGKYGFFHGHGWPSKEMMDCDVLFMGHLQPGVEFRDKFGYRIVNQVWLKGKLNAKILKKRYGVKKTGKLDYVVIPAFNRLLGSGIVNAKNGKDYMMSFVAHDVMDIDDAEAYLLDGSSLGKVGGLQKLSKLAALY